MVMTTVVAKSAEDSERGFVGKEGRIVERKENQVTQGLEVAAVEFEHMDMMVAYLNMVQWWVHLECKDKGYQQYTAPLPVNKAYLL